jgi:hypothetical protein
MTTAYISLEQRCYMCTQWASWCLLLQSSPCSDHTDRAFGRTVVLLDEQSLQQRIVIDCLTMITHRWVAKILPCRALGVKEYLLLEKRHIGELRTQRHVFASQFCNLPPNRSSALASCHNNSRSQNCPLHINRILGAADCATHSHHHYETTAQDSPLPALRIAGAPRAARLETNSRHHHRSRRSPDSPLRSNCAPNQHAAEKRQPLPTTR